VGARSSGIAPLTRACSCGLALICGVGILNKSCEGLRSTEPRHGGVASGQATGRESAHDTEVDATGGQRVLKRWDGYRCRGAIEARAGIVPAAGKHGELQRVCGEGGDAVAWREEKVCVYAT
jgi:hypothetical protein